MCPSQPNPSVSDSLAFLRASQHLGVLTGSRRRIFDANDAFLKMFGFTREKMETGQIDWKAITTGDCFPLAERHLKELRTNGSIVPYEKECVRSDGKRLPILIGAVRLSSQPMKWICWVVSLQATKDIAKAKQQSRGLKLQLDAELRGAYRIHEISSRLLGKSSVNDALNEILDAAIEVTEADLGNIQLVDQGILRIVAHRGCRAEFLNFFREVSHGTTAACGAALVRRSRVIIEDVGSSELFRGTPAGECCCEPESARCNLRRSSARPAKFTGYCRRTFAGPVVLRNAPCDIWTCSRVRRGGCSKDCNMTKLSAEGNGIELQRSWRPPWPTK